MILQAVLALLEKEVSFKKRITNIHSTNGDQNEPWFMRMNPNGTVPVLKDGDKIVCESDDIIDYIDRHYHSGFTLVPDKFSDAGKEVARLRDVFNNVQYEIITFGVIRNPELSVTGPKIPVSPAAMKKRIEMMLTSQTAYIKSMSERHPDLRDSYRAKLEAKTSRIQKTTDVDQIREAMKKCKVVFDDVEQLLGNLKKKYGIPDVWLVGPRFTAADVTFTILLHRLELLGLESRYFPQDKRPHIHDYYQRLLERKSLQEVLKEEKRIMVIMMSTMLKRKLPYVAAVVAIGVAIGAAFFTMKH
ncbi:hypothetical protein FSP39_009373 [Pinctada imbricata]|uniref:Ganglioside-induced differentiation-associated protein 1 n=1 Tax=Pinctada imbricata TaxID=66713 RepID=A0AA88XYT7_PINIB|nr:hypothetical protein FSP39_009373 [Pinctada imbricata]